MNKGISGFLTCLCIVGVVLCAYSVFWNAQQRDEIVTVNSKNYVIENDMNIEITVINNNTMKVYNDVNKITVTNNTLTIEMTHIRNTDLALISCFAVLGLGGLTVICVYLTAKHDDVCDKEDKDDD